MLLRRISILGRRRPAVGAARLSTLFPTATPAEDKPVQRGVQFPSDELGRRSSTATGKAVLAAALRGACTEEGDRLAQLVEGEQTWRENYQQHFLALVRYAATSPELNLKIAQAGLRFAHSHFEFVDASGAAIPFSEYMDSGESKRSFGTVRIDGCGQKGGMPLHVSYNGEELSGQQLASQLDRWAEIGCIEPDVAATIKAADRGQIDLSGRHFALIGAGAAMGPLLSLLRHGATVACIDVPGTSSAKAAAMWRDIIEAARASSGSVLLPLHAGVQADLLVEAVGCDLLQQSAEALRWLSAIADTHPLTVGNYTYLDGEKFVRLSLCADAVIKALCEKRPDTAVAFLGSPADIHVIPEAAAAAQRRNYSQHDGRGLEKGVNNLTKGKYFVLNDQPPVYDERGEPMHIIDGSSRMQGPNYLLAKRLQHWRSMVEFEAGRVVFCGVAPATRTQSVLSNAAFSAAFGGLRYFRPIEIFAQDTSSSLMGTLLISNVLLEESPANPKNRDALQIHNGLEMFKYNSAHGGVWRSGYRFDSILKPAVVVNHIGGPDHFWLIARLSVATIITGGYSGLLHMFGLL